MSAITDYFERVQRNAYNRRREPRWEIAALGIFLLALGAVVSIARHSLSYGRFDFALGLAAIFCAVTEYALRDSPWRWATRVMTFGMWCLSMGIALHW
jgi:hypothetical protein